MCVYKYINDVVSKKIVINIVFSERRRGRKSRPGDEHTVLCTEWLFSTLKNVERLEGNRQCLLRFLRPSAVQRRSVVRGAVHLSSFNFSQSVCVN